MPKLDARNPIPSELAQRLQHETPYIHAQLEHHEGWRVGKEPRESLGRRLQILKKSGLFYLGITDPGKISNEKLMISQAEVARLHGLRYVAAKAQSHWSISEDVVDDSKTLVGRSRNYLSELISSSVNKAIPRVDLALLAHVFQLPAAVLEAESLDTLDQAIQKTKSGIDLFVSGMRYLEQVADRRTPLHVDELPRWKQRYAAGLPPREDVKGVVVHDRSVSQRSVPINTPFVLSADLRHRFLGMYSVIALVTDSGGEHSLISTPAVMDHTFLQEAPMSIPPSTINEAGYLDIRFSDTGPHTISVVASKDDLSQLHCLTRIATGASEQAEMSTGTLAPADIEQLRDFLLRRSANTWMVLQTTVTVT